VIAKPIDIMKLWADPRQPRRVFPSEVRGEWQGDPAYVSDLLRRWQEMAEDAQEKAIDVDRMLMAYGDGHDNDDFIPAVTANFLALLDLAADICRNGLINPITAIPRNGGTFQIETGERRWLAFHLLKNSGDKFKTISTRVVDQFLLYRQAAENGIRQELNAISRARQLALLIMEMYADCGDLDKYETLLAPGDCDRLFYAQIADGKKWPVKDGHGQRLQMVTALSSRRMVSAYRRILTLPDDIWDHADANDWTEGACRKWLENRDREEQEAERIEREERNLAKIKENESIVSSTDSVLPTGNTAGDFSAGDVVDTTDGRFTVDSVVTQWGKILAVYLDVDGEIVRYDPKDCTLVQDVSEVATDETSDIVSTVDDDVACDSIIASQKWVMDDDLGFIPETHDEARSMVSVDRPVLAPLLKALQVYYEACDEIPDAEIAWVFEDIQDSAGQIEHEIQESRTTYDRYHAGMRGAKKTMRSFLETVAGHIDDHIDSLIEFGAECHVEYWEQDGSDFE
jgi:hypothetical protein